MVEQVTITEDEAALYDRQIRLWGLDAQRRLRASRVLLIGLRGLGAEVAKNIVLSGIKSLTLLDHTKVTDEDSCSQFLVSRDDVGKNVRTNVINPWPGQARFQMGLENKIRKSEHRERNRALDKREYLRAESSKDKTQQLNPMVEVKADTEDVSDKPDDFFTNFDVVCALCCKPTELFRINQICADNKIKFFCGDVYGYYGYMFTDLGLHDYAEEVPKTAHKHAEPSDKGDGEPAPKKAKVDEHETTVVKKSVQFSRLKEALELDWKGTEASKRLRRTPNTFFVVQVILNFMEKNSRRPEITSAQQDTEELLSAKSEVLDKIGVSADKISDDFATHCFAELSPVCAVVGGVLGQEIIKAVSHKDLPHNNFFFYNGVDGEGLVDKIGS